MDKLLKIRVSEPIPPFTGGKYKIEQLTIGGVDVTSHVTGVNIQFGVGKFTSATIDFINVEIVAGCGAEEAADNE